MADNTVINAGSGGDSIRDKDRAGVKTQIVGLDVGIGGSEQLMAAAALADATANPTLPAWAALGLLFNGTTWDRMRGDITNGLDVDVTRVSGNVTVVQGTAANLKVDASGAAVPITDNAGSLTVDAPVGTPAFVRLSDGAAAVTPLVGAQLPAALVSGRLDVNIGAASAVPTIANQETIADNAGFTDGTSKVFPGGYIFDEVAGTALTENDVAAARMDSKRAQVGVIEDATTRGQRAKVSATGGLLGDQGVAAAAASGWPVKVTDGTNVAAVKAASTAAVAADPAAVVALSPNNNVQANALFIRPRKLAHFRAVYKVAARPYDLSFTTTANTRKQFATLFHAAGATKIVRIRGVYFMIKNNTAAVDLFVDFVRLTSATTPATGNPAISVAQGDLADTCEATALALPTTAGTEGNVWAQTRTNLGVTGASASTAWPPPVQPWYTLWEAQAGAGDTEQKMPTMRAGNAEGWAVVFDPNTVTTITGLVAIEFTEE